MNILFSRVGNISGYSIWGLIYYLHILIEDPDVTFQTYDSKTQSLKLNIKPFPLQGTSEYELNI